MNAMSHSAAQSFTNIIMSVEISHKLDEELKSNQSNV